ncbi:MAG: hypothetical protein ACKVK8_04380, partial [Rhodospirillales bacterium]
NYVAYAYCLALSVKRHVNNSRIRFNCVDDETPALLMSIGVSPEEIVPRSSLIPIEVAARQSEYALNEFCWRCKPLAVRRAMEEAAINEWVIYLDSDMLAFGDIDHHLENNSESDVCITPHRSSARFAHYDVSAGLYNAGFVAFRSNQRGAEALDWWDSRCSERCSMDPTDDTYADQKYLEHMEAKFDFVKSIIDAGLNAAPWNIENYEIRKDNSGQIG